LREDTVDIRTRGIAGMTYAIAFFGGCDDPPTASREAFKQSVLEGARFSSGPPLDK